MKTPMLARLAPCLALAALLTACGPASERRVGLPACADPAATSRVNFRMVVERESIDPYPGADILHDLQGRPLTVRRKIAISGRHIVRIARDSVETSPALAVKLDDEGAAQLAKTTSAPEAGGSRSCSTERSSRRRRSRRRSPATPSRSRWPSCRGTRRCWRNGSRRPCPTAWRRQTRRRNPEPVVQTRPWPVSLSVQRSRRAARTILRLFERPDRKDITLTLGETCKPV